MNIIASRSRILVSDKSGNHLKSCRIRESDLPNRNCVRALRHTPYLNSTRNQALACRVCAVRTHAVLETQNISEVV